jgi:hypothetical protein
MIASEQRKSRAMQVAADATLDLRCSFAKPARYKRVPILRLPFKCRFSKLLHDVVTLLGLYDVVTLDRYPVTLLEIASDNLRLMGIRGGKGTEVFDFVTASGEYFRPRTRNSG